MHLLCHTYQEEKKYSNIGRPFKWRFDFFFLYRIFFLRNRCRSIQRSCPSKMPSMSCWLTLLLRNKIFLIRIWYNILVRIRLRVINLWINFKLSIRPFRCIHNYARPLYCCLLISHWLVIQKLLLVLWLWPIYFRLTC